MTGGKASSTQDSQGSASPPPAASSSKKNELHEPQVGSVNAKHMKVVKSTRNEVEGTVLLQYLQKQYNRYMHEVLQLSMPIRNSLDLSFPSQVGCRICDHRQEIIEKVPVTALLRLRDQISFQPPVVEGEPGVFLYDRVFSANFKYFPSCQGLAKASAQRVIDKLNRHSVLATECSFKLKKSFLQGGVSFMGPSDFDQHKLTYMPILLVTNLSSASSGTRLTVVPNKEVECAGGRILTFSDCIQSVTANFPRPMKFALADVFAFGAVRGDLQAMYNSIHYGYSTSLHTLTFCLKTAKGDEPTYTYSEAADKTLHCIRSRALDWGQKDGPCTGQTALKMATGVFRQYHPDLIKKPEFSYLLECVGQVIDEETHMDDICCSLTLPRLLGYVKVKGRLLPRQNCVCAGLDCVGEREGRDPLLPCPLGPIPPGVWKKQEQFMEKISQDFILDFSKVLCQVLNFGNFRLKFLKSSLCSQLDLDALVAQQTVYSPSDSEIGISRPTNEQIRDAICSLRPGKTHFYTDTEPKDPNVPIHLSHAYSRTSVRLKITHMCISCVIDRNKSRSTELYSYQDYIDWKTRTNPVLNKRSLFSVLSQNYCFTGRHLCLFKTMMKLLVRTTLISYPDLTWDTPLPEEVVQKMELAVQFYFDLVGREVIKPSRFSSYFACYHAFLMTDSSLSIQAQVMSVVSVTNLEGHLCVKSQHIQLLCYASHVAAISIPYLELLSLLRGVLSFLELIKEMEAVGVRIHPDNRRILIDNKICLVQARSRAHHFVKRVAHSVAKIQLCCSELQINPYTHLAFVDQTDPQVNFFPDHLTRVNWNHSPQQLMEKYDRLMDTSWLNLGHPTNLPGVYKTVGIPKLTDDDWIALAGVQAGEVDQFKCTLGPKLHQESETNQLVHALVKSAAVVMKGAGGEAALSCMEGKDSKEEWNEEEDTSYEGSGVYEEIYTDEEEEEEEKEREMQEEEEEKDKEKKEVLEKGEGKDTEEKEMKKEEREKEEEERGKEEQEKEEEEEKEETEGGMPQEDKATGEGEALAGGQQQNRRSPDQGDWAKQMERLIQRRHSKGLGGSSALAVLARALEFIQVLQREVLIKEKGDAGGRKGRQLERKRKYESWRQHNNRERRRKEKDQNSIADKHFQAGREDVDLSKETLGDFDVCWHEKQARVAGWQELRIRALQHLLDIFQGNQVVRGFVVQELSRPGGKGLKVLRGRRQKSFGERGYQEVRLRPVEEDSALEVCLLWSAHCFSRGLGRYKAKNGLACLNVHIVNVDRKLQQVQNSCCCCARRKAAVGRETDKIKVSRLGPVDYVQQAARWFQGYNTCLLDLHGPVATHRGLGSTIYKDYIVVFLEMPLHRMISIFVPSLSASSLLLAIETYAAQRNTNCDLLLSDFGSNLSRLQNSYSEMESVELDAAEENKKRKAWRDFLTARHGAKKLAAKGIFLRFASGQHDALSAVEIAQFQIKVACQAFGYHKKEALTYYEWQLVMAEVSRVILSRPLLVTEGKVYSGQSILRMLEQAGGADTDSGVTYHTNGSMMVTKELEGMSGTIQQLREEISQVLLAHLVKTSFLENVERSQSLRRFEVNHLEKGDVLFCERLFKKTRSVTSSLLQLQEKGLSGNHGLFKRVATHGGTREGHVGRSFNTLFFIAKGTDTTRIGAKGWRLEDVPTYQLTRDYPLRAGGLKGFVSFEGGEDGQVESEETKEKEDIQHKKKENKSNPAAVAKEKRGQELKPIRLSTTVPEQELKTTRSGRKIRVPDRFGSQPAN